MTLDLTKPVQTRGGRRARIICTDRLGVGGQYPIVALVQARDSSENVVFYTSDGRLSASSCKPADADLINVPERLTGWVNLYPSDVGSAGWRISNPIPHSTRAIADVDASPGRIGVAYIDTERLA